MDEQLKWKLQHCPVWFSICVEEIFKQLQINILSLHNSAPQSFHQVLNTPFLNEVSCL